MRHNSCIAALALLTFCGQAVAQAAIVAEPAPTQPAAAQPGASTPAKVKRPPLYDTAADGKAQIAAAIAKASRNNTRVLIQWGAEWCGWCHLLQGTFTTDRQIATLLRNEYEVVHIDIGQWDKHMDLAAKYGADLKAHGVPFLTVLDASGKAIANQETGSLERKPAKEGEQVENSHDPAKVRAFLEAHKAPPVAAADVLAAAKSKAASEGKLIFLHFGAPWCGWCHKLEDWMARPDIAPVLAKDFIDVKIDTDRMTGGKEMHVKTAGGDGGIPWFAFLSPDGKVVSHSGRPGTEPGDTVGFPFEPFEIEHFKTMLKAVHKNITDADIDLLVKSLTENAAKEKAKQTR